MHAERAVGEHRRRLEQEVGLPPDKRERESQRLLSILERLEDAAARVHLLEEVIDAERRSAFQNAHHRRDVVAAGAILHHHRHSGAWRRDVHRRGEEEDRRGVGSRHADREVRGARGIPVARDSILRERRVAARGRRVRERGAQAAVIMHVDAERLRPVGPLRQLEGQQAAPRVDEGDGAGRQERVASEGRHGHGHRLVGLVADQPARRHVDGVEGARARRGGADARLDHPGVGHRGGGKVVDSLRHDPEARLRHRCSVRDGQQEGCVAILVVSKRERQGAVGREGHGGNEEPVSRLEDRRALAPAHSARRDARVTQHPLHEARDNRGSRALPRPDLLGGVARVAELRRVAGVPLRDVLGHVGHEHGRGHPHQLDLPADDAQQGARGLGSGAVAHDLGVRHPHACRARDAVDAHHGAGIRNAEVVAEDGERGAAQGRGMPGRHVHHPREEEVLEVLDIEERA
mmetsp:Transcript_51768/g.123310  ORF Transcript_51768/g.123310 Transcript_51768/m.123310 type:complete len:462 (-) Transcript_51768:1702-3087(-)